jgi:DNA-binding NarL/FixJ family response regulator
MSTASFVEIMPSGSDALEPIRVGLFTNEPIRIEGLSSISAFDDQEARLQLIPVTGTPDELLADSSLKYMVVDLNSECCTLKTPDLIRRVRPDIRQIVIGRPEDEGAVGDLIAAGAKGYLSCTAGPEKLRRAIEAVEAGAIWARRETLSNLIVRLINGRDERPTTANHPLTAREGEVLRLVLKARSNREIASELGIEERTVQAHVTRLMRKAGVNNRIGLTMQAMSVFMLQADESPEAGQGD